MKNFAKKISHIKAYKNFFDFNCQTPESAFCHVQKTSSPNAEVCRSILIFGQFLVGSTANFRL